MWTDFNNSFIVAYSDKLRKKMLYNLPSRLKSVAALYLAKFEWLTVQLYSEVI